jgi:hypothetical protein
MASVGDQLLDQLVPGLVLDQHDVSVEQALLFAARCAGYSSRLPTLRDKSLPAVPQVVQTLKS